MSMERRKHGPWVSTGVVVVSTAVAVCLTTGVAASRAQQLKGGQGLQGATAQLQQQMAMEQAKTFAPAQVSGTTANPRQPGNNPAFPSTSADETPYFQDSLRTKRNDERQKRLESDTQRLLTLANQLKNEVSVTGAESMTPEMLRQMDEIEKLAKSVKERMRS